jgi:hypothetical protein
MKLAGVEVEPRSLWWCQFCYFQARGLATDGSGSYGIPDPCPVHPCQCRWCDPARYQRLLRRTLAWRKCASEIKAAQEETTREGLREQRRVAVSLLASMQDGDFQ